MPEWTAPIELAAAFGQLPDDVAEGMSEDWFWRSQVYLSAKNRSTRKEPSFNPADYDEPTRVDEQGAWILTG